MKLVKFVSCLSLLLLTVALAACAGPTIPPVPTISASSTALIVTSAPAATSTQTNPPAATTTSTSSATSTASANSTFTDPFAYCAAVVNIDQPDARFVGPKMPDVIAEGLKKASGASADAPMQLFTQNAYWRCMNGKVYACTVGANLPCDSKANTDKTATSAEIDYCKANPSQDIPAYVTGHDTIYAWHCNQQTPITQQQVFNVDGRGYIKEIWYEINP